MHPTISLTSKSQQVDNLVLIMAGNNSFPAGLFSKPEKSYILQQQTKHSKELISFNRLDYNIYVYFLKDTPDHFNRIEECRKSGDKIASCLNELRFRKVILYDVSDNAEETLALAEGMALGCYQFLKYKQDKKKKSSLEEIEIYSPSVEEYQVTQLNILVESVYRSRTLINEPNSFLTAGVFAKEIEKMAGECNAVVEVMNKKKLEALKMEGLLGVNKGSSEPPTFTVMEWNPANAGNKRPIVLVGKGIVFDSGGMNLKPGNTMMDMKDDMSGAAAVAATIFAIAKAMLPVHVIGLMPATDNRPGPSAIVPGDVIKMHSGTTVEIIDTDAEGRLILADALSYARKYKPELVIDLATLTGSAVRAVGKSAAVVMHSKAQKEVAMLIAASHRVHERLIEFPLWDDYGDLIKSEIADIKNLGPPEAGSITAGKFLQKFTDYPYIHIDIAGPAFLDKRDSYRGQGGTGFGVRLLFEFIKMISGH
ncbi:MAG: leucyl aminopeptidase family protein [bacterium]